MAQSVQVNTKLPDLGSSFHFPSPSDPDPPSYSVQTPYGFQLDLDFLKYVEEIESGQGARRAVVPGGRRSARGLRTSQRSPGVGGRSGGWTSTESLASPGSEDGRVAPPPPPRHRLGSAPCEARTMSPVALISVPPLSAGAKVPPPPPQRNPRVERTLMETSLRLQQEQNGAAVKLLPLPVPLLSTWSKPSPQTSGRSTPAGTATTPVPPSQLQTVREQMATALKQLKEMEERVRGVPDLEKEVARLKVENDLLLLELQGKNTAMEVTKQMRTGSSTQSSEMSTQTFTSSAQTSESSSQTSERPQNHSRPHTGASSVTSSEKMTEKSHQAKNTDVKVGKVPELRSVGVGEEKPMDSVVFYYREGLKDAAVDTVLSVKDVAMVTEATTTKERSVQAGVDTEDQEVWVLEAMLGVAPEAQREIDTLQDTIKFQQESISALEERLSEADRELKEAGRELSEAGLELNGLRALKEQIEREKATKATHDKDVLAKPDTENVQTETTVLEVKEAEVWCCAEVRDVSVGESLGQNEQETQTEAPSERRERGEVETVSTACQCEEENLTQEQESRAGGQVGAEKETTLEKQGEQVEKTTPKTGLLKSIMKRNDGNGSGEKSSTGKKSLQFVGILNGGYESTSSEEEELGEEEGDEDEDGSSSGESDDSGDSGENGDSSEDEAVLDVETSEEERNINLDESDTDEEALRAAEYCGSEEVKEKFELSSKMREACLILKNHLNDDDRTLQSKETLSSSHTVQLEWFRVSSAKTSPPSRVSDYLMAFAEVSSSLLEHVINMTDGNGNTALHYSVSHSNFSVVGLLLDTGLCSVDQQNKAGYTAIMLAALSTVKEDEDMAVVKKLFSQGNVNAKASQAGQTALMLAVSHGRLEMVRALLECGADVNVQDDEGSTALMCASEHGRTEIVKLLLDQPGCDISIVDNDGSNALSIALEASHNDTAVLLYAHMNYVKTQGAMGSPKGPLSPSIPRKSWPSPD